ncbi:hypothetical protein NOGI109294_27355 [Nocardiopsis gilva]
MRRAVGQRRQLARFGRRPVRGVLQPMRQPELPRAHQPTTRLEHPRRIGRSELDLIQALQDLDEVLAHGVLGPGRDVGPGHLAQHLSSTAQARHRLARTATRRPGGRRGETRAIAHTSKLETPPRRCRNKFPACGQPTKSLWQAAGNGTGRGSGSAGRPCRQLSARCSVVKSGSELGEVLGAGPLRGTAGPVCDVRGSSRFVCRGFRNAGTPSRPSPLPLMITGIVPAKRTEPENSP